MRNLRIGYWPLSKSMDAAGDRRRVVFWANARGHKLISDLSEKVDVIIASENADFNSPLLTKETTPIIFDLVDAYLSPRNSLEDLARGWAKKLSGQITGPVKPFSHHVSDFCRRASLVICSSVEQELVINQISSKTRVILDCHDEIPMIPPYERKVLQGEPHRILWEGQPATIKGIKQISSVLAELNSCHTVHVNFITDQKYFKLLNKHFEGNTMDLLEKVLDKSVQAMEVVPWSPSNLVEYAEKSSIAMIPIDLSVPMQMLKPENRLLIMWRLGLPCLTSPSPAYARVAKEADVNLVCENLEDWSQNFTRILSDSAYSLAQILKGQNYLHEFHNREILLNKWDAAIQFVLD